jgi:hypothetical protein
MLARWVTTTTDSSLCTRPLSIKLPTRNEKCRRGNPRLREFSFCLASALISSPLRVVLRRKHRWHLKNDTKHWRQKLNVYGQHSRASGAGRKLKSRNSKRKRTSYWTSWAKWQTPGPLPISNAVISVSLPRQRAATWEVGGATWTSP